MKKITLFIVLFLGVYNLHAQCPTEDIVLSTQEEVDTFVTTYASTCTDIPVNILIRGSVTDLSGLNFITSIQGNLSFSSANSLNEISGFTGLTTVEGNLYFGRNANTTDISGFDNLISVTGTVSFSNVYGGDDSDPNYQNSLELIGGFSSLQTIGGDLNISQTRTISVDGFYNLETVGGNFRMRDTKITSLTGLTSLERIEGDMIFYCVVWNDAQVNAINDFTALTSIGGSINLLGYHAAGGSDACSSSIGLDFLTNLSTIEGDIYVQYGSIRSGLSGLEIIEGNIYLQRALSFPTLAQLHTINGNIRYSIHDDFFSGTNASMDFPNLETVGGDIRIEDSSVPVMNLNSLTQISGDIIFDEYFFGGNNIGTVSINSLVHMNGSIILKYDTEIHESFSMSSLQTIGGDLRFTGVHGSVENISFPSLYGINGNFYVHESAMESFTSLAPILHTTGGSISIYNNGVLTSLNGLESVQNIGGALGIQNNDNLTDCTAICEYVSNHTNYNISNNTLECVTSQTCTSNTIQGIIQQDFEFDGCTTTDAPLENISVIAYDGTNYFTTFTNENGAYIITVPEGSYSVYANTSDAIDVLPISQNVTFTGSDNTQEVNFCATFNTIVEDISLTITPIYFAVPGFQAEYSIIIENHGTVIQNGTVDFTFSDANLDFSSSSIAPTTQAINTLTWDYTNLIPGETRTIIAYFDVLPPPTTNIGDILTFSGNAPLANDANPNDNQDTAFQIVVSSYDPNDKTVLEGEHVLIEDIDEYLHYVIRFQNEGTAPAVNIRIVDFMSDLIDWETFEPVDASHDYQVSLVTGENPELEFFFNDIYLPDSTTDEPNSHGYIAFRVKPKNTVQLGDIIDNRAAIYFDFNAPIVTNKTETRIVEDPDDDGIYSYQDNCPYTPNANQADQDGDGMGDACDDDTDGDGILNVDDNCPLVASDNQNDNDDDGLGDICDDDDDNDTILDVDDNCPFTENTDQNDNDEDGMGDVCDDDDDDDGILDIDDNCPFIANPNQEDFDEDGIGDLCDDDDDNDGILDVDDDCPYYNGTTTDGCPFILPIDNYLIQTESETCASLDNAKIDIKATENHNYEVDLKRNGTPINLPVNTFTEDLLIENLDAGTYELCFSITAENYEQCFTVIIGDPAELHANSALSRSNEYTLDLTGAINYSIFINGEEFTVIAPDENTQVTFSKQLSKPINTIEVQTEKACQGKYTEIVKTIENLDFTIVPNPTIGDVFMTSIIGNKETKGILSIYDVSGRVISTQMVQFPMQNQRLKTNNLTAGVYFITLKTENYSNTKKLIKQ